LCLLACEATGGDFYQALPAAAAIELVHNFSLIHDDIEDGSPQRRHRGDAGGNVQRNGLDAVQVAMEQDEFDSAEDGISLSDESFRCLINDGWKSGRI
jgi:hypothetical protein